MIDRSGSGAGKDRSAVPIDHVVVGLLGLVTISAYGSWYYSFGVLLDPIRDDTGWGESSLATSFSVGIALAGIGSLFGGRLLDRVGTRTVLTLAALGGAAGLLLASFAQHVVVFLVGSAVALSVIASLGFYHVTMAAAVRLHPSNPARAISVLTIWGAFASAIYLPLTGALVGEFSWRVVVRILAVSLAVVFLGAAALLPGGSATSSPDRPPLLQVLLDTFASRRRRALTAAISLGGVSLSCVLVYQVPAMTAAGLSLTTAATIAGIRGFCQLGGRLPLSPLIARLGSTGALRLAFAAMALGGALLAVSGTTPVALAFAVVTGFGIGAFSPLQGIKAEELFDRSTLGATMGFYGTVLMLAGALGPALAGVLVDATGDRRIVSAVIVVSSLGAVAASAPLGSTES